MYSEQDFYPRHRSATILKSGCSDNLCSKYKKIFALLSSMLIIDSISKYIGKGGLKDNLYLY